MLSQKFSVGRERKKCEGQDNKEMTWTGRISQQNEFCDSLFIKEPTKNISTWYSSLLVLVHILLFCTRLTILTVFLRKLTKLINKAYKENMYLKRIWSFFARFGSEQKTLVVSPPQMAGNIRKLMNFVYTKMLHI